MIPRIKFDPQQAASEFADFQRKLVRGSELLAKVKDRDAGRAVRCRHRREFGCRRRRGRPGGAARLLLLRAPARSAARAIAERPSTSPAACVTTRTPGLAHRLRLNAPRAACPGATSKTV